LWPGLNTSLSTSCSTNLYQTHAECHSAGGSGHSVRLADPAKTNQQTRPSLSDLRGTTWPSPAPGRLEINSKRKADRSITTAPRIPGRDRRFVRRVTCWFPVPWVARAQPGRRNRREHRSSPDSHPSPRRDRPNHSRTDSRIRSHNPGHSHDHNRDRHRSETHWTGSRAFANAQVICGKSSVQPPHQGRSGDGRINPHRDCPASHLPLPGMAARCSRRAASFDR
jgi:hypothetical protein